MTPLRNRRLRGFTVIELLVVLAAVALLLSVVAPAYIRHVESAREVTLKQDLSVMRDAIDKFRADQSRYPAGLSELVQLRYLRELPVDPITQRSDSWVEVAATAATPSMDAASMPGGQPSGSSSPLGMADVHSGAAGKSREGSAYATW